jgi:hypothetical protein
MLQDALGVILIMIALVRPASAQARFASTPGPAYALFRPAPTPPRRAEGFIHSSAPDYRWEGLVIGALALGAFSAYFVTALCRDPDYGGGCAGPIVEGTLLGGTVGGFAGVLVGILIPKHHSASTP